MLPLTEQMHRIPNATRGAMAANPLAGNGRTAALTTGLSPDAELQDKSNDRTDPELESSGLIIHWIYASTHRQDLGFSLAQY